MTTSAGTERSADNTTFYDDIEAYCGQLSYLPGQTVGVHVSTTADSYSIDVERWGGTRTAIFTSQDLPGEYLPAPEDADCSGCDWPVSVEVELPETAASGYYLITLTAAGSTAGRDVAHAGFVVRAPEPSARALLVLATNTWNAYNIWGGKSLYTGGKEVSFQRPFGRGMLSRPEVERDDRKARPIRWDEAADADGEIFQQYRTERGYPSAIGSSGWFTYERRFVEWAERHGYAMDFAVSSDLDRDPSILDGYDLMLSVGHDEYWSAGQRTAVESFVERGGNLASFSGNTMFWQVRLEDDGATMVCHKYSAHETDPIMETDGLELMSGMWCDPIVGKPEWTLLGGGSAFGLYYRFGQAVARGSGAFTVYRGDHWLFDGTGLRYGDLLGARDGAVGYETLGCRLQFDEFQLPIAAPHEGMPADVEVVAFAPASSLGVGEYPKSIAALSDQGDLEFVASRLYGGTDKASLDRVRFGNAVMLTCRPHGAAGGEVVTVGTTDWAFGLAEDADVDRVTRNVLDRYTSDATAS